jgi:2-polyprenyl-3-methyl-5-hydroxy-6-metoxy-1,4-benzoquinol methylase
MIDRECYNCGGSQHSYYAEENGYTLVKCPTCGLLYVNPRPSDEEVEQAVKTGLHRGRSDLNVSGKFSKTKVKRYSKILGELFSDSTEKNQPVQWLDIGAGHGEFMRALQLFFNSEKKINGIEPNTVKREAAKKIGLSMVGIEHLLSGEQYDRISALNVFSHLPDPIATINQWKKLLKPSGELIIQTGNTAFLPVEEHPRPFHLPDHLSFISKSILIHILEKCGFHTIDVRLYRSEHFPVFTFRSLSIEIILTLKTKSFKNRFHFFPKNPNLDMWIRAKLNN